MRLQACVDELISAAARLEAGLQSDDVEPDLAAAQMACAREEAAQAVLRAEIALKRETPARLREAMQQARGATELHDSIMAFKPKFVSLVG